MAFENLNKDGIKYLLGKLKTVFVQIKDSIRSINGQTPDENGNVLLNSVPYAQNLQSEMTQENYGTFIERTSGGEASIEDGDAWLMTIKGASTHDGFVPEVLEMTVTPMPREEGVDPITATLDRGIFIAYVESSSTITLTYTTDWSANPALYGVTVTGTPIAGDIIAISYTKEERGTITVTNPLKFISTGWNLFNYANGYARALKYTDSDDTGFRIEGTYTAVEFSTTISGTKTTITPTSGTFGIPADGYIWVTGGNSTDTAVYMTRADWTEEANGGTFEAYEEDEIDLTAVMEANFPYGLLKAGSAVDEINLNLSQAISRVERLAYSTANLETAKASGREYEYDEDNIYLARASAVTTSISIDGSYATNDHGIEFFTNTEEAVDTHIIYGNNLKNKLERDVLTISEQALTQQQKTQVLNNIGTGMVKAFNIGPTDNLLTVADNDTLCPYGITIINLATGDGSGLPSSGYKYGKAIVEKYAQHRIVVTVRSVVGDTTVAINRMGASDTWGGWELQETKYFTRNKQYVVVSEAFGYVTNGTKSMFLDVILPKALDRAPTITKLNLVVRGIQGYVDTFTEDKDVFAQSGFQVTCSVRNERLLRIVVEKAIALTNVTNNTPIVAQVNNITFTA